jgi:hypothetical protein
MKYIIEVEGQKLPVDEETGKSDEDIKAMLEAYYPDVKNAKITRTTAGDVTTIAVVKQAGKKGLFQPDVYARLLAAAESENPAIVKARELAHLDEAGLTVAEMIEISGQAEVAIAEGVQQESAMKKAQKRLMDAKGSDVRQRPAGF